MLWLSSKKVVTFETHTFGLPSFGWMSGPDVDIVDWLMDGITAKADSTSKLLQVFLLPRVEAYLGHDFSKTSITYILFLQEVFYTWEPVLASDHFSCKYQILSSWQESHILGDTFSQQKYQPLLMLSCNCYKSNTHTVWSGFISTLKQKPNADWYYTIFLE